MIKTLAARIGGYKREAILAPLFSMMEAVMTTLIPMVMASIIDDGIEKGDIRHVYVYGALMVFVAALALLSGVALAWSGRSLFTVAVASCAVVFICEMILL